MTRKEYIAFAQCLVSCRHDPTATLFDSVAIDTVAKRLAVILARDNARFDPSRFLHACGVESGLVPASVQRSA